jgi:hypothetical protein
MPSDDAASTLGMGADLGANTAALADLARLERFFDTLGGHLANQTLVRLVLSKPRDARADLHKLMARPLLVRQERCLSMTWRHATKDITRNPPEAEALQTLRELLGAAFAHGHLFTATEEIQLTISKRGKVGLLRKALGSPAGTETAGPTAALDPALAPAHDRQKQRWLPLEAPFLFDLGVTDAQHRLVPAMARKWKQINKFVEILDHALDTASLGPAAAGAPDPIQVVDFGAGKGYLTFAMHYHLVQTRGWPAEVVGVELRQDLVDLCNAAAERRLMAGLRFVCGDVRSHVPARVDVMVALHACDTATDHALHTGIRDRAAVILCSPCCHKQLRPQMQPPALLQPMLQHGIHLGLQAEMLTDSLRALLLEAEGYDAQVFEFVALEHTSKNKMILAVRRPEGRSGELARRAAAREQIAAIKAFYGVREHCLEGLLRADAGAG